MSGYSGSDDKALHAIIFGENGIAASRSMLVGSILKECQNCGGAWDFWPSCDGQFFI